MGSIIGFSSLELEKLGVIEIKVTLEC